MTQVRPWVEVRSPAKVNWILRVGPLRDDGFHTVHTALLALDLCDEVRLQPERDVPPGDLRLSISGPAASPDIPTDERNLILRAWRALPAGVRSDLQGLPHGWHMTLHKRIPSQAGLGGGSSNAAAGLAALWKACSWRVDEALWQAALDQVGSDCAFFGRLHALASVADSFPAGWYVDRGQSWQADIARPQAAFSVSVITPDTQCATGAVYGAFDRLGEAHPGAPTWRAADWARRENHLQAAACTSHPALARWAQAFEGVAPGRYQLAGSGASFYAPCASGEEAESWHQHVLQALAAQGCVPRFHWVGVPFRAEAGA